MSVIRTFYGWHRSGLAAAVTGPPPAGAARAAVPASIWLRGTARTAVAPTELYGPADVAGLDPREVRRSEPHDGATDFEPAYFPYVELFSPDLPWRFSPAGPVSLPLPDPEHPALAPAARRLVHPWLALVVVPVGDAVVAPGAPGRLPVLTCDTGELPAAGESWAWAHVQTTTGAGENPADAIGDPSRSVARLLCPRRLEPAVRYVACLVPTFAAGRAALLGDNPPADPLTPAWGDGPAARLPVFFSFGFTTAETGTFETLARRLRPRPAPKTASLRTVATGAPGWGVPASPRPPARMQGALRPLALDEPDPDPTLATELAAAVSVDGAGVQLRAPLYGQDHAAGATAVSAADPGWFAQLNTDPRRRLAAGLASWAVAVNQEELSDRAWRQLAAAGVSSRVAGDPELAGVVSATLTGRNAAAGVLGLAPALLRLTRRAPMLPPAPIPGNLAETPAGERFTPAFDEAAYTYLRAIAPEWLLPGAADVPNDSVVVLRTNPAFAEAFLVGLNHALARELVWRRYPLNLAGTMFRRFWSAAAGAGDTAVPPLAEWAPQSGLGSHSPAADQLVLLVRGSLLRRFPTAAVYLSAALPGGGETRLAPTVAATLDPGSACFGFPITPDQALHPAPGGPGPWSVVIAESAGHARFGCAGAGLGAAHDVPGWHSLGWDHPQLAGHTHVPVAGELEGRTRPLTTSPGPVAVPSATWGADAGQLAAILQRPAFRIRIPVALWLDPEG